MDPRLSTLRGTGLALGGDLYSAKRLRGYLLEQELYNDVGILESMVWRQIH